MYTVNYYRDACTRKFYTLPTDTVVVAFGSGRGPQMITYRNQFKHFTCIDVYQDRLDRALEIARDLNIRNVSAINANVQSTPLGNASCGLVLAIDVIEDVQNPYEMLQEAKRILAPEGKLLITFPAMHDKYMAWF